MSSASGQAMETLSKSDIMTNLAKRKQYFFATKTSVEQALPYDLQSREKQKQKQETKQNKTK